MKGFALALALLSIGCGPVPAGSVAASPVPSGSAAATASVGAAGAPPQRLPDGAGGTAGTGTGTPGAQSEGTGTAADGTERSNRPAPATGEGESESGSLSQACLPYGQDVILRGVVERPPLSASAPVKKPKNRVSTNTAWRFRLDSPRCVGAPPEASGPVTTMILVPLRDIANTYRKLEGERVEATGVLVGLVSGSDVHVVYMVRAFRPAPSSP